MRSDKEKSGPKKKGAGRVGAGPRPAVVGPEPLGRLRRQAEKLGLIIHGRSEGTRGRDRREKRGAR